MKQRTSEKKNRKKGLIFAICLHSSLIVLALLPFLTQSAETPVVENYVEIAFASFEKKTTGASQKQKSETKKKAPKPLPTKVITPKPEPKPKPKPKPAPKPILIDKTSKEVPIETAPKKEERAEPVEKPSPKPTPKPSPKPKPAPQPTEDAGGEPDGNSADGGTDGADEASNNNGKSTMEGNGEGTDFDGDGLFNRKVIYRADVKKLIKENGKLVIELCVNQDGRVVFADYNKELSTIKDQDAIDKAVSVTRRYRFEKDYYAAAKQCGRMTYVFKVD